MGPAWTSRSIPPGRRVDSPLSLSARRRRPSSLICRSVKVTEAFESTTCGALSAWIKDFACLHGRWSVLGAAGMVRTGYDFSDRESSFLTAVATATRLAVRFEPTEQETSGHPAIVVVSPQGEPEAVTQAAQEWQDRLDERTRPLHGDYAGNGERCPHCGVGRFSRPATSRTPPIGHAGRKPA